MSVELVIVPKRLLLVSGLALFMTGACAVLGICSALLVGLQHDVEYACGTYAAQLDVALQAHGRRRLR